MVIPIKPSVREIEASEKEVKHEEIRCSDTHTMVAVKRVEAELPIPDLCRELGISTATFYKWRSKFGGIDTSMMSRMKELEDIFNERYPRLTLTIDHMDLSELQTGCPI